jgi:hypothetical protein
MSLFMAFFSFVELLAARVENAEYSEKNPYCPDHLDKAAASQQRASGPEAAVASRL